MHRFEINSRAESGGIVYSALGNIEVHNTDPGFRIAPLASVRPDDDGELRRQPSRLLAEAGRLVRFHGRREELRRLGQWRDAKDRLGVVLIHGSGGQGKTRLAQQFADSSAAAGWAVLGARLHRPGVDPEVLPGQMPVGEKGRLLVIDYAERWPVALLRSVLFYRPLHDDRPTRIVLISRPAGDWWRRIRRLLRDNLAVEPARLPLGPLSVDSGDRDRMFTDARDAYARELGVPAAVALPTPAWSASATALEVHMTALAAVFAVSRRHEAPTDAGELSAYLLDREYEHWAQLHERQLMNTRPQTMARAVYLACLAGPLRHAEAVALVTTIGLVGRGEETMRLIDEHALSYPAGVLAPLQPDRLAEDFVALLDTDAWTDGMPATILETLADVAPDRVSAFLLTLVAVADRSPAFLQQQLSPLLRKQPAALLAVGGHFLHALAAMNALDSATLTALEEAMPLNGSMDLMDPLVVLTDRLYGELLAGDAAADRVASVAYRLARRLAGTERYAAAQEPIEWAIAHWGRNPVGDHDERLARAWCCHAEINAGLGRLDAALASAERAVRGWPQEASYTVEHAAQRDLYARLLFQKRQRSEAAEHQRATSAVWRSLAAKDPALRVRLARSLAAEATYLRAAGRSRDASDVASQTASLWSLLDQEAPDGRHRGTLIAAWTTLASSPHAPADTRLEAGQKAVRALGAAWRHDLTSAAPSVRALCAYAAALRSAGQYGQATAQARAAMAVSSTLDLGRLRNRLLHARALTAFARACVAAEQDLNEARHAAQEAEKIFDDAGRHPESAAAWKILDDIRSLTSPPPSPPHPPSETLQPCPQCGGDGVERRVEWGRKKVRTLRGPCQRCHGKGEVFMRTR